MRDVLGISIPLGEAQAAARAPGDEVGPASLLQHCINAKCHSIINPFTTCYGTSLGEISLNGVHCSCRRVLNAFVSTSSNHAIISKFLTNSSRSTIISPSTT